MKKIRIIQYILLVIFSYLAVVSNIQRFKNPKLTQTELFMLIPQNILLNFK